MFKYMQPEGTVLVPVTTHLTEQFASIPARAPMLSPGQMFSEQLLSVSLEDFLVSWAGTHCIKGMRHHT